MAQAEAERKQKGIAPKSADAEPQQERSDEEMLAELELPDPDTLQPGDDFSAFMAKAVPDRLRRRALRKLWLSNPVLANLDELVDYGEDYTDAATVVENLQTAYQVGKGMLARLEKSAEVGDAENSDGYPRAADAESVPEEEVEFTEIDVEPDKVGNDLPVSDIEDLPPLVKRRMRFAFSLEGET